jgi:hypothetical protein
VTDCVTQAFDFGIRIVQLARWLKDEGKDFPLAGRLLESGSGLRASLRTAKALGDKDCLVRAFLEAEVAEYLLELMVKTDFITVLQSEPLLADCRAIKKGIRELKATQKNKENGGL